MAESSKGPGRRDFHANPMLGKAEALGFIVAVPYHRPVVDLCLIAEPLAAPFLFGKLFINAVQSPWLQRHQALQEKLASSPPAAATFRGIEGSAGRIFYLLAGQSLPERYRFARRSLRPAQDPFNSFLNYAYAVLYNRVEEAQAVQTAGPPGHAPGGKPAGRAGAGAVVFLLY